MKKILIGTVTGIAVGATAVSTYAIVKICKFQNTKEGNNIKYVGNFRDVDRMKELIDQDFFRLHNVYEGYFVTNGDVEHPYLIRSFEIDNVLDKSYARIAEGHANIIKPHLELIEYHGTDDKPEFTTKTGNKKVDFNDWHEGSDGKFWVYKGHATDVFDINKWIHHQHYNPYDSKITWSPIEIFLEDYYPASSEYYPSNGTYWPKGTARIYNTGGDVIVNTLNGKKPV